MAINPIQVQKFLGGIDYPTTKQDLMKVAQKHGADKTAMDTLQSLKWDKFNSPNDVSEAIGKLKEPANAKADPKTAQANAKKQSANAKTDPKMDPKMDPANAKKQPAQSKKH